MKREVLAAYQQHFEKANADLASHAYGGLRTLGELLNVVVNHESDEGRRREWFDRIASVELTDEQFAIATSAARKSSEHASHLLSVGAEWNDMEAWLIIPPLVDADLSLHVIERMGSAARVTQFPALDESLLDVMKRSPSRDAFKAVQGREKHRRRVGPYSITSVWLGDVVNRIAPFR